MKKNPKLLKENHKKQINLTMIFAVAILLVLGAAVTIFISATFIFSELGFLNPDKLSSPDMNTLIIGIGLISIAIGFAVALLAMKHPLKPFNQLINQLNRLCTGDFKARLNLTKPFDSYPAFKEISESFNKMAEELEGSQLLRSDFINNISHEFKTPIVSIAGFAKLLKRDDLTEEQRKEYINIIEEESLRLASMATNVLNLTKIENQAILTDVTNYNLTEQIRSCLLLLESKWEKKNITPLLDMEEIEISANEELLKQVFINLIDNAIKFSKEDSTIEISASSTEDFINLTIKNSGEINEENLPKIFNRFYQADESHSKEGNGVGLAIVKKIVTLHCGEINVKSQNGETEFTVSLPANLN